MTTNMAQARSGLLPSCCSPARERREFESTESSRRFRSGLRNARAALQVGPLQELPRGLMTRMVRAAAVGATVALAVVTFGVRAAAAEKADEAWPQSRLLAAGLRSAEISLMPEGTPQDYELFRPLAPTVVAWGEDALSVVAGGEDARAKFAARMSAYREIGVSRIATNVWMLTATERFMARNREYIAATCVDLWGEKILPRWLADAEFEGVKPWWGCTNNPLFVKHLLARMKAGLQGGATMVHLDDHSGTAACAYHAGGCFCRYCTAGFREWLAANVSPDELAEAGIGETEAGTFDYAAFLRKRGYADRAAYIAEASAGHVPLRGWFLAYQREAAVKLIARMQHEAAQVAGAPVAFGVNAYNLLPAQLFDAHVIDYFANEVEHFDVEDTIAPVVYRLGEALGRPVFATGTGEDWIAYRQGQATVRVRGWIAQAYAFGQYFMYSWRKWGFSEKTGTLWTEVPPEVFTPMTRFVSAHPELFDGFENAATTALLYDNATAAANRWGVRDASRALLDAHVPYGLVVAGDELLKKPLRADDLAPYRALVIPEDVQPVAATAAAVTEWEQRGGRVVRATDAGLPGKIELQAEGRVWIMPRVNRSATDAAGASRLVLHLLNRDYQAATDTMKPKTDLTVTLDPKALGGPATVKHARYFRPDADPVELRFATDTSGNLRLTLPGLNVWGIVALD